MKLIDELQKQIEEEIEDATKYAKKAVEYKSLYPETAELYFKLSGEEQGHFTALHKEVVRLIEKYRREKGEPPAEMMAIYNYLHQREIEKAERVGVLQGMYKK